MSVRDSGRARANRAVNLGKLGSASGGAIRRSRSVIVRGRSPSFELAENLFIAVPFALQIAHASAEPLQDSGVLFIGT
jgi:hypothetical protein